MAEKTSILQEAIAEAKQVRQVAIQNAYKSLEENLTPSIKAMLESKLEEELDLDTDEESSLEEANVMKDFKEVKAKANVNEEEKQDEDNEDPVEKSDEEDADPVETDAKEIEDDAEEVEDDAEEVENDTKEVEDDIKNAEDDTENAEKDAEIADDTKLEDLTIGDLKNLISDLIGQVQAEPAPEGNEGVDMEAADVEGQGEEEVPLDGVEEEPETGVENGLDGDDDSNDEEIDLAELLRELEEEDNDKNMKCTEPSMSHIRAYRDLKHTQRALAESKKQVKEAMNVISELRGTLSDVNLLNAKLVYTSRMLTKNNLTESQKANVIKTLDRAKSPAEVKTIYKTLTESIGASEATVLKEHRAIASRSAGRSTAPKATIVEVNPVVRRFQQLAGIIE